MSQTAAIDFKAMRNIDIRTFDRAALTDIRDIKVNTALPQAERLLDYIRQGGHPYVIKCGKMLVQSTFTETEPSLEDKLESHFLSL